MKYAAYEGDSVQIHQYSPFFWDHVVRYWWANGFAKDFNVLDCATGKGYGAYIIAQNAKKVTGIDLNEKSIAIAKQSFSHQKNLEYKLQDVFKLDELNEKFDLITAFEIIEHLDPKETDRFILALKNALNPGGILLISTPNHDVVLKSKVHVPHFHINNLKAEELKTALLRRFKSITMIGQFKKRSFPESLIFDLDFFNFRHLFKNIFRSTKGPVLEPSNDEEDSIKDHLNTFDFKIRPVEMINQYRFSNWHYRQAGLTVAICYND